MIRVTTLALLFLAAGCGDKSGEMRTCHCEYITDTDLPGSQVVDVCVAKGAKPEETASECTRALGVGDVDHCACSPAGSVTPCTVPVCQQGK